MGRYSHAFFQVIRPSPRINCVRSRHHRTLLTMHQPICSRHCFLATLFFAIACFCSAPPVFAQEEDQFEGAVWQFAMSQKKAPQTKLIGRFRISKHVVFQKEKRSDAEFSKQVGKNHPVGKKTRMEVAGFRVFEQANKKQQSIAGTARLKMIRFGEWTGVFTDEKGVNWDIKCSRIME